METKNKTAMAQKIAIGIIILSFLLFGLVFSVPFLPLSISYKAALAAMLWALSEITLFLGAFLIGKELFQKIKKNLNPGFVYAYLKSKILSILK